MPCEATDQVTANTKRKAEEAPDIENPSKRLKQSPTPFEISKPGDTRKKIRIVPFPEKVGQEAVALGNTDADMMPAWGHRRTQW